MLFIATLAYGLVVNSPLKAPHVRATVITARPLAMSIVDDVKSEVVPSSGLDQTLRNVMGLQMTAWGVGSLFVPKLMMDTMFATSLGGASIPLMRATGLCSMALGAKTSSGSDADAAMQGFLFFGMWTHLLRGSGWGAYTSYLILWNAACALSCARRQGGLFDTVTKLDTGALSSILPRDNQLSTRNMLGVQLLGWGVMSLFFQNFLTGGRLINGAVNSVVVAGCGIANTLLAGRVFGGSDSDAASTGLVVIGGYGVIGYLAKTAGLFTGSWMTATVAWNLLFAAYCLKEKL